MRRNKVSPLFFIGDVFKTDFHNPVKAKRRLRAYKLTYIRMGDGKAVKKLDKAIKLI